MIKLWWRLVRFAFRLLYNELAFTYDWVSKIVSVGAWRCWQRASFKHFTPGAFVLELAHGTGDLQLDLHAAGYRSIGYDLSPYMGRITQRKLRNHNVSARLARGLAQQLPFPSHTFDVVASTFPTEFIFAPTTLNEIRRVLRPDGKLVIVINGVLTGGGVVIRLLEWLYRVTGQRATTRSEENRYAHLSEFFTEHGFSFWVTQEPCRRSYAQVIVAQLNQPSPVSVKTLMQDIV